MRHLKLWAVIAVLMYVSTFIGKMFLLQEVNIGFPIPISQSIEIAFVNLGIYFGISGSVLWLGKLMPVRNRIMVFALVVGYLTFWLQYALDAADYHAGLILPIMLWAIGIAAFFTFLYNCPGIARLFGHVPDAAAQRYVSHYFYLTIIILMLGQATTDALDFTQIILPQTIDADLYKIDAAFWGFADNLYATFIQYQQPLWQSIIISVYSLLAIVLTLLFIPVLRERREGQLNVLRVLIVPFICAYMFYCFTPVAGPLYVFEDDYPANMGAILAQAKGTIFVPPTFRNGMPSMHFAGAMLMVLVAACLTRKVYFYAAAAFAAITFIATMAMGEHYLMDLIVAAPLCIALGTALINPPGWHFYKRRIWWVCMLLFAAWEIMLHADTTRFFLADHLWFVRLFSAVSVIAAVYGFAAYLRAVWYLPAPSEAQYQAYSWQEKAAVAQARPQISVRWVFGLFVCSGFAGLLYEVVFAKHLGVIFGGTSLAAYTVMATYMGGMALGAWLGGLLADRVRNPLKWYALFEAVIGVYALATPALFKLIAHIYVAFAADVRPDSPVLTLWRVLLGVIVLGIPTILMGTTLPIMFKFLRGYLPGRGNIIAHLYTANIMGAALGALIGAYVVLLSLGLTGATRLAALFSLMIALYAIDRLKKLPDSAQVVVAVEVEGIADVGAGHVMLPSQNAWQRRRLGIAALWVVSLGGVVTLALEIVNMHMLAVIAGNSVYAFGLMLATFLCGLGLGSTLYDKLRRWLTDPVIATIAQLGIFFAIIISAFQWDGLVDYFASFGPMGAYHHFGFAARELIRAAVCAIIMMPPAFFIGLGYPATMALASDWLKNRGEAAGLGIASLCNTLGNIAGVLLAGFVFLNWLGSNRLLFVLAILSLALALYMAYIGRTAWPQAFRYNSSAQRATGIVALIAIVFALWSYPAQWNLTQLTVGANVYFSADNYRGEVIDSRESIQGGLTTVNSLTMKHKETGEHKTMLTLLTNGKFQGNNAGEVQAQRGVALTPLLHVQERGDVLVIGYGTGNSAHVLHEQGFAQMDIAELAADMVDIADIHFGEINKLVSQQDNVRMYYTDGRNLLLTQNKRYDLISMEISSIWFAGAANLYNREFYQLVKARLKENGVLQQWVQLHHMQPMDLLYILNTLHQEFRYVWLYVSGGQGVLVASNTEESARLHHLDGRIAVSTEDLDAEEKALHEDLLLEPADMDYLAQKLRKPQFFVSTDNNLYLEYSTPKGNALAYDAFTYNINMLEKMKQDRLHKQNGQTSSTRE
ncbi:phosphatase PAP2 family protein [Cardiobacterium valvarum]|uniref:phosphatase PAP2 family protein n=1 Tax=Cardiobacterium valvarum TaxID=194702 RepID=UPI0035E6615A